jgi:hypothetical protein
MKVKLKGNLCLSMSMALAMAVSLLTATNASAQSQTAQSAMVNVTFNGDSYLIEGTTTWSFNKPLAATYYTNLWDGISPVVTCTGGGSNCVTAPPTPAAAAPDANSLSQHAQAQRCVFFYGGDLASASYTQQVIVSIASGINKGNWKFTYTYGITPNSPGSVAAETAWSSVVDSTTVDVGFTGFVASESFLKQSNKNKYSFTMVDGGVTRARDVSATLQKSDGLGGWTDVSTLDLNNLDTDLDTFNDALAIVPAGLDFTYFANGGTFGNSAVFGALHSSSGKPGNLVTNILKGISDGSSFVDNFAGNDNDLASGNVHGGPFSGTFYGISSDGSYRVKITGTLKGNGGSASDLGFTVGSSSVVIGGCPAPVLP